MSSKVKSAANAAAPVVKRDINKWLAMIRQFLMLREFTPNQRHEFEMSKRTHPAPLLPGGFAHKLNKNYYFDRDARRQVGQPQVLFSTSVDKQYLAGGAAQPQLPAGTSPPQTSVPTAAFVSIAEAEKQTAAALNNKDQAARPQLRTPGRLYNWDG